MALLCGCLRQVSTASQVRLSRLRGFSKIFGVVFLLSIEFRQIQIALPHSFLITELQMVCPWRNSHTLPTRSLLSKCRTVVWYLHKCNFTYVHMKSTTFSAPIFPKLTNPELYYVHIRYSEFHTNWIINAESTERNSFTSLKRYSIHCAEAHVCSTTSLKEHHNTEIVYLWQTVLSLILVHRLKGRWVYGHGLYIGSLCGSLGMPKNILVIRSHKLAAVLWVAS